MELQSDCEGQTDKDAKGSSGYEEKHEEYEPGTCRVQSVGAIHSIAKFGSKPL
jgi:hypothetical protein